MFAWIVTTHQKEASGCVHLRAMGSKGHNLLIEDGGSIPSAAFSVLTPPDVPTPPPTRDNPSYIRSDIANSPGKPQNACFRIDPRLGVGLCGLRSEVASLFHGGPQ